MVVDKIVSVIIPNYNNEKCLPKCLQALFQNEADFETIIVDDASTDNSLKIAKEFPIQIIRHEHNLGPTRARNNGAKKATGKYLLFLDGDMEIEKDYLAKLVSFLENHPQAGAVSGKITEPGRKERMFWTFGYDFSILRDIVGQICLFLKNKLYQGKPLGSKMKKVIEPFTLNFVPDQIRTVGWVRESAFMTRRELFEKLGGFDRRFTMFAEGPDYCRRMRNLGFEVYYLPEALAQDLGGHAHSTLKRLLLLQKSMFYYYLKHPKIF